MYQDLFYRSFRDSIFIEEQLLTWIFQFLLTLVSAQSKHDSVMQKKAVFMARESCGYLLLNVTCVFCYSVPLYTNHKFTNRGLKGDTSVNDYGRYRIA